METQSRSSIRTSDSPLLAEGISGSEFKREAASAPSWGGIPGGLSAFAADIKISHSVFALPWALLATFMAAPSGRPALGQIALIVACMVLGRTCAMGANRYLDAQLDTLNPRTRNRAIPSGRLTRRFIAMAIALCALAFVATTSLFGIVYHNWIPLGASLPVLVFICAYPFIKRFSNLCHYYLGAALASAPVCAWVAVSGRMTIEPLLMAAAVLVWTAGFDILYACQDYASDLETGVHSIPARLGISRAMWVARASHVLCIAALFALGWVSPLLGVLYFAAIGSVAVLMLIEHALVKPNDLSKLNVAFFTLNGIISLLVGTCGVIDVLRHASTPA